MSDLFDAPPATEPPPARRARAPRAKTAPAPAAPAQASRPAAELQVVQEQQPEPQTTNLPTCAKSQTGAPGPTLAPEKINIAGRQYGRVTLHDGRQVDSASEEWRRETLARHLLTLAPPERDDWLAGWPADAATEMRLLMRALRATDRVGE